MKKLLVIASLVMLSQQAQAFSFSSFFKSVVKIVVQIPIIGNLVDNAADSYAHRKANAQVDQLFNQAKSCSPLETDRGQNVHFWMSQKPGLPGWQDLDKINNNRSRYYQMGSQFSQVDKIRHCYVGCVVAREVNYASAVFVGWYKELQDSSDCSSSTRFELQDQDATVAGAIAASRTSCESFCGRKDLESASGSALLSAAQQLPVRLITGGGSFKSGRMAYQLK
jgi:hypothetical protein